MRKKHNENVFLFDQKIEENSCQVSVVRGEKLMKLYENSLKEENW